MGVGRRRCFLLLVLMAVLALGDLLPKANAYGSKASKRVSTLIALLKGGPLNTAGSNEAKPTRKMTVVPPGAARVFILEAHELTSYTISLSATTMGYATGGNGTKDFSQWPREGMCNGAALHAVAYREDQLPVGILPPMNFTVTVPTEDDIALISQLEHSCSQDANNSRSPDTANNTGNNASAADLEAAASETEYNSTWASYRVLRQQFQKLHKREQRDMVPTQPWGLDYAINVDSAFGDQVYSRYPGYQEANRTMTDLLHLADSIGSDKLVQIYKKHRSGVKLKTQEKENLQLLLDILYLESKLACYAYDAELKNPLLNITLGPSNQLECARQGAKIYVFVYNCLIPETDLDPKKTTTQDLLVSVDLNPVVEDQKHTRCFTKRDWTVWYLNWTALFMAALVTLLAFVALEVLPAVWGVVRGKTSQAAVPATNSSDRGWHKLLICAMRTMNSPSGHSRLYTVAVTTTAALLVAAIVWQPALDDNAQHDHAWLSNPTSPDKESIFNNKLAAIEYYGKVMGISAVIGYMVKLALLANLGVPDPGSGGVVVQREVWRTQVVVSTTGLLVLSTFALSNVAYLFNQSSAWTYSPPYMYLVTCLVVHLMATWLLFVMYTFIKPPPLKSSDYKVICSSDPLPVSGTAASGVDAFKAAWQPDTADRDQDAQGNRVDESIDSTPAPGVMKGAAMWLISFMKSLPEQLRDSYWEDRNDRFSAWILIPVWVSACMMIFWYLMGVTRSDVILQCIRNPHDCIEGQLGVWLRLAVTILDIDGVQQVMQVLEDADKGWLRDTLNELKDFLQEHADTAKNLPSEDQALYYTATGRMAASAKSTFDELQQLSNSVKRLYGPWQSEIEPKLREWKTAAEHAYRAGRWCGYTLATVLAFASLLVILKTFKRVLSHQQFMHLIPEQQQQVLRQLTNSSSTDRQAFGRAMSLMRETDHHQAADADSCSSLSYRGSMKSNPYDVTDDTRTAAAAAGPYGERMPSLPGKLRDKYGAGQETKKSPSINETLTQRASTEIMYRIQMLEADMQVHGIGASVALFGVLVSTMWIQIRVVGFILMCAFTVIFHPLFWVHVMGRMWVSIVTIIALILFNMFVVKRYIGSRLLSDGTNIRHRGAWMTFYLMCQLAFLVIGVLYASWRVVFALLVLLLYGVACLDRSILLIAKFLDGSYIAFVSSIKLESAWRNISQQQLEKDCDIGKLGNGQPGNV